MKFGFVDKHRHLWPVRMICAALGISTSGYYAWRPESRRIHAESAGCYGAPRVHAVLRAAGRRVGRNRVARLIRLGGLRGLAAPPDPDHGQPPRLSIAPNRRHRHFTTSAPTQIRLVDLTYIRTGEGWLLLAAIDPHIREVVGWSMRETLHASIALEAPDVAIRRQRPASGLIQHSDRGVQCAADECSQALAAAGPR